MASVDIYQSNGILVKSALLLTLKYLAGKPLTKGTYLAVEFITDFLAKDGPESEILRNYPSFTHEYIQACLSYAMDLLRAEK